MLGRRKKETDPLGRETAIIYDSVHNVTEVRRPDHDGNNVLTIDTFAYDYGHRRTSHTATANKQKGCGVCIVSARTALKRIHPSLPQVLHFRSYLPWWR